MPDITLVCSRCQNPFVYSEYEQRQNNQRNQPAPFLCPICFSITQSEAKHPPKPPKK